MSLLRNHSMIDSSLSEGLFCFVGLISNDVFSKEHPEIEEGCCIGSEVEAFPEVTEYAVEKKLILFVNRIIVFNYLVCL